MGRERVLKLMQEWMQASVEKKVSDIFIGVGRYVSFKVNGVIIRHSESVLKLEDIEQIMTGLYDMAGRSMDHYKKAGDDDFSVAVPGLARFRVNAYHQRGTMSAVIRLVTFDIPDYRSLNIPDDVIRIAEERNGLVLVTGVAGSGKSTTLACIIDTVNNNRNSHIITLEDPIEFLHRDKKSLVSQREIAIDTETYITALRTALRQAPDIILLGEMRDYETISAAMTAVETGQLVISTLHTTGAVNTVDRIVDVFPSVQQRQIRVQLSLLLRTVISQQLLPRKNGGMIPAYEIMHLNSAIRNLIREDKIHQIDGVISTSSKEGMISMDNYIVNLYKQDEITKETALDFARDPEQVTRRLSL